MKLSLAVVALAAGANAFNAGPEVDFDFTHFRIGHTGVARDAPLEIDPRAQIEKPEMHPRDAARVEVEARDPHFGNHGYHRYHKDAPIFVEAGRIPPQGQRKPCHGKWRGFSISGLLSRLGFGGPKPFDRVGVRVYQVGPHGEHRGEHHKDHGHHDKAPMKPEGVEAGFAHILPIFGEDASHKAVEAELKAQAEDDKHHKHKDGKYKHKEHHHKHKDGEKHKHHKGKHHHKHEEYSLKKAGHKLCDALKELPPGLRGFVVGALIGSVFQVFFSLIFLAVRLRRRGSCEARRARRAERKEARKAAKAAYKANKAARQAQSKAAEAGYADEEEALPSYAEGETDALVVRQ